VRRLTAKLVTFIFADDMSTFEVWNSESWVVNI